MNSVILIAHGNLAEAMKASAEMIYGELSFIETISFGKEEGMESLEEKIKQKMSLISNPVLILADLFCGTPYNASCAIALKEDNREMAIVSGMSLPLVLEIATMARTDNLECMVEHLKDVSSQTVQSFSRKEIDTEEDI